MNLAEDGLRKIVFVLSGQGQTGKSAICDYLVNHYGFEAFSLHDPLKKQLAERYLLPRHYFDEGPFFNEPLTRYPVNSEPNVYAAIKTFIEAYWREKESRLYWTPKALLELEGNFVCPLVSRTILADETAKLVQETPRQRFLLVNCRGAEEIERVKKNLPQHIVKTIRVTGTGPTWPREAELGLENYPFDIYVDNRCFADGNTDLEKLLFQQIDQILENVFVSVLREPVAPL